MAARAGFALLCLCVAALPPEELEVLQQLLPLAAEPCETDGVECGNGHVTLLGRAKWWFCELVSGSCT